MQRILLSLTALLTLFSLSACHPAQEAETPVSLIFETDMGNDVDDVIALDLIHKAQDAGKARLLMVGLNKSGGSAPEFIDIMDTWYGYPDIPIGIAPDAPLTFEDGGYNEAVCALRNEDGTPAFPRSLSDYGALPTAVRLYRQILAAQPDRSVVIASVGFSTNLADLMESVPDDLSPLDGMSLIRKKVKLLSIMAGDFTGSGHREYNVVTDLPAARKVIDAWPTEVVLSPWELGMAVQYPATSIENDFDWADPHPLVEAYKAYLPMPYDRATWDPTAVLYALDGDKWFTVSEPGLVRVDENGVTTFTPDPAGTRRCLSVTPEQAEAILTHFLEIVPRKPAGWQEPVGGTSTGPSPTAR